MEIVLVRHTSVDVPRGVCYGSSDVGVAEDRFEAEASMVKDRLRLIDTHGYMVLTSPLKRCRRLCDACGFGLSARIEPLLTERDFGEWELKCYNEITDPQLHVWYGDWLNTRPTGGESFRDVMERVSELIYRLQANGVERLLAFTHGGVIAAAQAVCGMPVEEAVNRQPPYGGVICCSM